jgi:hypothetical protein
MKKVIVCLMLFIAVSACVQTVEFPVVFDKKLVVHGFISPQNYILSDSIMVSVSTNSPIIGSQTKPEITNAVVTLTSATQNVTLPLMSRSVLDVVNQERRYGIARQQFSIKAGEDYSLLVKTPDGLQAQGACKIPLNAVPESDIKINILEKSKDKIRCQIDWKDIANEDNFYICSVILALTGKNGQTLFSTYLYAKDSEAVERIQTSNELVFANFGSDYDLSKSYIYVAVANIEKNYYDWGAKQIFQQRQNNSNLFPEPVFLNGNLGNGLGIFTGYHATLILKPL